jgi:small-conductance mechanosensitive channel
MITDAGDALLLAFSDALRGFFAFLPRLFGAVIVLVIGLFVGRAVGALVTRLLRMVGFDRIADRAEIDDFLRNAGVQMDPARMVGELAKWFVFLIFFQVAASALGVPELTAVLNQIVGFIPRVVVALVILLVGALAANFLAGLVRGSLGTARVGNANLLATVVRWGVVAFAVVAALSQLQIAPEIVNTLWTALIGGLGLGMALAFGLGAREAAGSVATGQMIKGDIQPGMEIGTDGAQGTVEHVGALFTTVRTAGGQVKVPNAELARSTIRVGGR